MLFCLWLPSALTAADWELINNEDGIKVYRKEDPNSNMFEFKGQGVVYADAARVITFLTDIGLMTEWVDGCKKAKMLERNFTEKSYDMSVNQFYMIVYGENSVPWPLQNRDYILKGKISYDAKRDQALINLKDTKHAKMPPQSGLVRMNFMKVRLTLKPIKNDKYTWVQIYVHLDPGGVIPAWAVNFISKSVPYKTIKKLRKLVKREKYNKEMEKLIVHHILQLRKGKTVKNARKNKDKRLKKQ